MSQSARALHYLSCLASRLSALCHKKIYKVNFKMQLINIERGEEKLTGAFRH